MNKDILHCEGLPCPQPVLQCKRSISENSPDLLIVYVDNDAAKENVSRFLIMHKYKIVKVQQNDDVWQIQAIKAELAGLKPDLSPQNEESKSENNSLKTLVFISSDKIGSGNDQLGSSLMLNFISTLPELEGLWRIILVNGGVKLAVKDSPTLEALQQLEKQGISILVCGTCLNFFNLLQEKQVGETTNMLDVVTSLQLADKVISV
ncbi:MAG: sulfurtransferase-like selenium metabolism protein YedF [Desulfonauticus sp.]|nr:sulfurtransferase-like selenium metabolism protein YedF [Desulfonauticus sp.]